MATATVESVLRDALSLSNDDRAVLEVHLRAAVRGEVMPGEDVDWSIEIPRRLRELADGADEFLSDEQVDALIDEV